MAAFGLVLVYGAVLLLSCTLFVFISAAAALKAFKLYIIPSPGAGAFLTIGRSTALADSRVRRSATARLVCLIGV